MQSRISIEGIGIKERSFFAKLAAYKLQSRRVALVLGKTIHLHGVSAQDFLKDECWVKHELCHIKQFHHYGFIPFLVKYFLEFLRNGYYNNKYEVEARLAEND